MDASDDNLSLQSLLIDDPIQPIESSIEPPEEEKKVEYTPKIDVVRRRKSQIKQASSNRAE